MAGKDYIEQPDWEKLEKERKLHNSIQENAPAMYELLKEVLPWAKEWIKFLQTNIGPAQGAKAKEVFDRADAVLSAIEGGK